MIVLAEKNGLRAVFFGLRFGDGRRFSGGNDLLPLLKRFKIMPTDRDFRHDGRFIKISRKIAGPEAEDTLIAGVIRPTNHSVNNGFCQFQYHGEAGIGWINAFTFINDEPPIRQVAGHINADDSPFKIRSFTTMRIFKITTRVIGAGAVALALGGCDNLNGDVVGGEPESATGLLNDGGAPTVVTDSGNAIAGNFICSHSVSATEPDMVVGSNGLVGGVLTNLLGSLGLDVVANLLNSVSTPEAAADGNLDTAAGVTLTAGLLGGVLTSVDLTAEVRDGGTVPSGYYAIAGLSFPGGVANLSLFNSITVQTSLLGLTQEVATLNQSAISLLGINGSTVPSAWIGLKATRPYDKVTVSLVPGLLSVNVGNAVRIHEFCYDGRFVIPKAS